MIHVNYFSECTNEELKRLWAYRDRFSSIEQGNPIHPYMEKYCATENKLALLVCEVDFYKECARRFFENNP